MKKLTGLSDTKRKLTCLTCFVAIAVPFAAVANSASKNTAKNKPFSSMAIAPDVPLECRVPRPPTDLAPTAYLRNGYRAILRILIAEEGLKTENCLCLLDQFTWTSALENLKRFQTSDSERLPFKVLDLYDMADAIEIERAEACGQ